MLRTYSFMSRHVATASDSIAQLRMPIAMPSIPMELAINYCSDASTCLAIQLGVQILLHLLFEATYNSQYTSSNDVIYTFSIFSQHSLHS